MTNELHSVVISQKLDGSWQAKHVPSGKVAHGLSKEEAEDEIRKLLGIDSEEGVLEPVTSDRFSGVAKDIAIYLEGPVSDVLSAHDGYARLEAYENSVAQVRLGGGCEGCPASSMTLIQGVLNQLQDKFGEEIVSEIQPAL